MAAASDNLVEISDLEFSYGPRKLLYYQTRADIFVGRGDPDGARRTLEEAVAFAEALPEGQRSQRTIDSLKKKLDGLRAANAPAK